MESTSPFGRLGLVLWVSDTQISIMGSLAGSGSIGLVTDSGWKEMSHFAIGSATDDSDLLETYASNDDAHGSNVLHPSSRLRVSFSAVYYINRLL